MSITKEYTKFASQINNDPILVSDDDFEAGTFKTRKRASSAMRGRSAAPRLNSAVPKSRAPVSATPAKKQVRTSAFRPPGFRQSVVPANIKQFLRDPPMKNVPFAMYRYIFNNEEPVLEEVSPPEDTYFTIQVATDWKEGLVLRKAGKPFARTGLIGLGGTKTAFYVSSLYQSKRKFILRNISIGTL